MFSLVIKEFGLKNQNMLVNMRSLWTIQLSLFLYTIFALKHTWGSKAKG